nr:hypothetical protein [Tanacetum cinerariifolium]
MRLSIKIGDRGVSHNLRGDSWGCVPRSLFWQEGLDRDEERRFDCLTFALALSKARRKGCRSSWDGFPYWRAREFLQVIKKMRGKADVIKASKRSREEECKELQVKCQADMKEFSHNPVVLAILEKISLLISDVREHKEAKKARLEVVEASLRREVKELKQDRRDVVSKVVPYAVMQLVHINELGRLVCVLVSSAITYGRCKAYEQVATMKDPFDLLKSKGYHSLYKKEHTQASNDFSTATFPWLDEFIADASAPIEALLSKKLPVL